MRSHFWRSLLRLLSSSRRRPIKCPTVFRPRLEVLEDLVLPAATLVPTYVALGPLAGAVPVGLSPTQIRHAYGFDQITFNNGAVRGDGSGETIAIVDAFDDPSIASDLAVFDSQFGLPAPGFTKVGINAFGQASTSSFPTADAGWAGEIELDVEWAHAVAPGANILLVEANSASNTDLLRAVDYARNQPGVVAVSMSWGGAETLNEANNDSHFTTPAGHTGVTFFGSSGDSGSPAIWPALSTHVVAVGGTTLSVGSTGNYLGESGWSGSGGSRSKYLSQPSYQVGLTIHNGSTIISANGKRTGPDVSYDASPNSGVAVYGSFGWGGWAQVGGTSAAAPQWAGLMAIVDQGRALAGKTSMDGFTQTLPALYKLPSIDFHDITSGSNGFSAGPGYDLVTGLGTPIANLVVRDLSGNTGGSGTGTNQPPTIATPAQVVSQTSTSANLHVLGADDGGEASLTYTWSVVGTPPGSVSFSATGTNAAKDTTAMFGAVGTYTLRVTVTDAFGLSTTSQVTVTTNQTLSSITVSPASATVAPGGSQQFSATARDQFGNPLALQPAFSWSLSSTTQGTISPTGLFTASSTASGTVMVRASAGGFTGSVTVTISGGTGGTGGAVLFSDNFETGGQNWTVTSGYYDYSIVNDEGSNRLLVVNDGTTVSRAVAGQTAWTNYSYQATLNVDSFSVSSISLLARVQDNTHLYFFGYDVADGAWMIAKRNGSYVTTLALSAPYALRYFQDYTVRADVNGSSLKLYVGGVLVAAATDATFTYGKIGFSATNASGELDNVVVTQLGSGLARTQTVTAQPSVGSGWANQSVYSYVAGLLADHR